jgi:hypothetical protein
MTEGVQSNFRGFLVRSILRRYSFSGPGLPAHGPKWAEIGWRSESCPELLINVCDAWGVSVGQLAVKSKVEQSVLSSFIMGVYPLSEGQMRSVTLALHEIMGEKNG